MLGLAALVLTLAGTLLAPDLAATPWAILALAAAGDAVLSARRGLRVEATAPDEIFVGETADLRLSPSAAVAGLTGAVEWPAGLSGPAAFAFGTAAGRLCATAPMRAARRGEWTLERLWLTWPSRLGLFEVVARRRLGARIAVVPNIRPVQSGAIATTVLSTLHGIKENRAVGEGSEFHQLREFAPGMDVKAIDWKRSARRRTLLSKELRAERNHHVILALDTGHLMREEVAGLPKIDHAINAALATAWAAAVGGGLVGFFAYEARPTSFVAPAPGRLAFARMRRWAAGLAYAPRATNHVLGLGTLKARTPKRSLVVVFADFVDAASAELVVEAAALISKTHLVIFVAIRDPELERIAETPPASLDGAVELIAAGQLLQDRRIVFERLARLGVSVLDVRPGETTGRLVAAYLEIKARKML
ncbi:DUF58 domain-containing protein [Albimonas pacifica]|uniref:Uncharacterized conserved protein, DUF58 family, contains vWF domain n=1 Tax=Albimonas pacifica TaxID=1114924 RepID=A0A1I3CIE4_9RHOB|nr:DUF58 domain-containing protein [Albimonas pacifica]SFH73999.1 Uncharacterized conserved protein, DUF58 family, contains vWF domain [Albimonas pacifica]